jgi:hypothetical protein
MNQVNSVTQSFQQLLHCVPQKTSRMATELHPLPFLQRALLLQTLMKIFQYCRLPEN